MGHRPVPHLAGLAPQVEGTACVDLRGVQGPEKAGEGAHGAGTGFWASPCKFLLLILGFSVVLHRVYLEHQSLEDGDIFFIV